MDLPSPRAEEKAVLESIYTLDELSISDDYKIQFRLGTPGTLGSFVVNITWPKGYPFTPPVVDLDEFCNHHVPQSMRDSIIKELNELALENSGEPLTFTLIEHLRDNIEEYAKQLKEFKKRNTDSSIKQAETEEAMVKRATVEKEVLTKAQKRKQLSRLDETGNLPRGWNWVDVIKHLRQTGTQANPTA
ncbi:RWD domain-containing protein 4 [Echinococcus granulosus]|uniref:RWD domain containing protein 4 n=1 Tax=Echinococcus granulosus TaxID=6210 RepID=U6J685_ECHGR|nr:RWD domain-containing protein 4A [Echinococcus granulosus]XP_024351302.1 RWD domain-containing protein 4A [Echinococcus granulosus]EUB60099.1 RWD domain-containing protein 4A [Echinococcus granulosus]EUB60106.1 RWD domain-containing protein 4A [Echinococcus granulosus]KAH9283360.1 RWD domain-containing protein 4 [Echinococcus granulosus]CDS17934.1 RWD domain containing protein 4 [Echinococcus granulosus]